MSTDTVEQPVEAKSAKKTRIKRSPSDLKVARITKAEKALQRVKDSGAKVVKRATVLREKADAAQAKADAHAESLKLAEANLRWEQARPVRGETLTGDADEPFADNETAEDFDEDEFDEDNDEDEDSDDDADDDDL